MEFRDLEYFAAVAQHGNLSRAAEALGLSGPALSKSLRRLQASIGVRLVERAQKGVRLTAAGQALLARVAGLRLALRDARREAAELADGVSGYLRIGVSQVDSDELSIPFSKLLQEAPKLRLEIVMSNNEAMLPSLREGHLDMVLNVLPALPYEGTVQETLFEDEFVVCASARHRLAGRKKVTLADIAEERWAFHSADVSSRQVVERVFSEAGLSAPRIALEARSIRIRLHAWAHANLLGINSKRLLMRAARSFRLVQLPVRELTWPRPVGLIWRAEAYVPPAARRFVKLLVRTSA